MSQANILTKLCGTQILSIKANTGQCIHIRNHSKIYPWRHTKDRRECNLDPTRTPYTDRHNLNEFTVGKRQKKDWQKVIPKDRDPRFYRWKYHDNYVSDPLEARKHAQEKFYRLQQSAESRGFARDRPAYDPPEDVEGKVLSIFKRLHLDSPTNKASETDEQILAIDLDQNRGLKFNLLTACNESFGHDLPTSALNDVQFIGDLVNYYSTPVRGVDAYASMLNQEDKLPANLALIAEPIRFDRETDTYFGGYTAFPGIVSKVPGIRAAKKYPILNQDEFQWPDI